MYPILTAWILIVVFMLLEGRLRTGEAARRFAPDESDRQSSLRLGISYGLAIVLTLIAPLLNRWGIGQLAGSAGLGWLGVGIMLTGIALRAWATRVLGQFYTRTLITTSVQHVVQQGPYRVIRHPGYLGSLLFWVGGGLATVNWLVALVIVVTLVLAYRYRIQSEEAMMVASFGHEYQDYIKRTWRLIPLLL